MPNSIRQSRTQVLTLACLVLLPASAGGDVTFQGIGVLPHPSLSRSAIAALSADGRTAVGTSSGQPFRWTAAGGIESLGVIVPGGDGHPQAVNGDGTVIVGYTINNLPDQNWYTAFRWTPATGIQRVMPMGSPASHAYAVSRDGAYIAGEAAAEILGDLHPVRWGPAGQADITLGLGTARAISGTGSVVAGSLGSHAFRWGPQSGLQDLGTPVGTAYSSVRAMTADATVMVGRAGASSAAAKAALWRLGAGWQQLGALPGHSTSEARVVSDDGQWIAGSSGSRAMLYGPLFGSDPHMVDLNVLLPSLGIDLTGWTLSFVTGISADGMTLAGTGQHTLEAGVTRQEGWVATIPAPSAAAPAVSIWLLAARRRRRAD